MLQLRGSRGGLVGVVRKHGFHPAAVPLAGKASDDPKDGRKLLFTPSDK